MTEYIEYTLDGVDYAETLTPFGAPGEYIVTTYRIEPTGLRQIGTITVPSPANTRNYEPHHVRRHNFRLF